MNNIFHLIKVQLLSSFGINKLIKGKKTKFFNGFLGLAIALLFFLAIFVGVSIVYSNMFAEILVSMGQSINRLVPIMQSLSFVIVLFLSFYSVSNVIYEFKDYDTLASLPIKRWNIIVAKFSLTILLNLLISIIVVVPSLFVCASRGGTMSAKTIFNSLLMMFFSPLLPLAISCVIGVLFLLFSSLFKRKNLIQILLYLLLFAVYGVFSYVSFGEDFNSLTLIEKLYFIMPLTVKGIFSTKYALLVCLINIISFIVVFTLVCLSYNAVKGRLLVKKRDKNFSLKIYTGKGQLKSLYLREMKRLFSIPIYTINGLFGSLMVIVLSVLMFVLGNSILQIVGADTNVEGLITILLTIIVFCTFMSPLSNSAISLEGSSLWVIRTLPLDVRKVYISSILVNSTFSVIPVALITIIGSIILKFSFITAILFIFVGILIAFSSGTVGLMFNILFPKFKWENAQQVVKQSLPVFLTMLTSLFISALMILFGQYVSQNTYLFLGVFGGLFLLLTIFSSLFIAKKGEQIIFNKIDS